MLIDTTTNPDRISVRESCVFVFKLYMSGTTLTSISKNYFPMGYGPKHHNCAFYTVYVCMCVKLREWQLHNKTLLFLNVICIPSLIVMCNDVHMRIKPEGGVVVNCG